MRIRIIKTPPAYVMDGFDVRGLRADRVYDVDPRMAKYLVMAAFAVRIDDDEGAPHAVDEEKPQSSS